MKRSVGVPTRVSLAIACAALAGCNGIFKARPVDVYPDIKLLAVMPLVPVQASEDKPTSRDDERPPLTPDAARIVTAQIYSVMVESPKWHFVPDLTVDTALRRLKADSPEQRASALGKAVNADGVLYGEVWRFRDRLGSEYGARFPASVAFRLALLEVASGKTVWQGEFDQTQQPLSENLLDWWMFWRVGPRWFTGAELSQLGVEQLLEDLQKHLE